MNKEKEQGMVYIKNGYPIFFCEVCQKRVHKEDAKRKLILEGKIIYLCSEHQGLFDLLIYAVEYMKRVCAASNKYAKIAAEEYEEGLE